MSVQTKFLKLIIIHQQRTLITTSALVLRTTKVFGAKGIACEKD